MITRSLTGSFAFHQPTFDIERKNSKALIINKLCLVNLMSEEINQEFSIKVFITLSSLANKCSVTLELSYRLRMKL